MSTSQDQPTPKAARGKFNPRDPDRADFPFLEKVITFGELMQKFGQGYHTLAAMVETGQIQIKDYQRNLVRSQVPEENYSTLRKALLYAYKVNPEGLVEAVAGGPASRPKQYISQLWEQACGGTDDNLRRDMIRDCAVMLVDRYALERRNRRQIGSLSLGGQLVEEVRADDKVANRSKSTNMITCWDPEKFGVVSFLQGCIKRTILPRLIREHSWQMGAVVSLDKMKDETNLELVEGGWGANANTRFSRVATVRETEGGREAVEEVEEVVDAPEALTKMREQQELAAQRRRDNPTAELDDVADEPALGDGATTASEDEKVLQETIAKSGVRNPATLKDPNRPDCRLLVEALGFLGQVDLCHEIESAASPEARYAQMQKSAVFLAKNTPGIEDQSSVIESAEQWKPGEYHLHEFLPEIADIAKEVVENQGVRVDKPSTAPKITEVVEALAVKNQIELDLGMPLPTETPQERMEHCSLVEQFATEWRHHFTPEERAKELANPKRVDIEMLRAHSPSTLAAISGHPLDHKELLRKAAASFVTERIEPFVNASESPEIPGTLKDAIQAWDPRKNTLHEVLSATIMEMVEEGIINEHTMILTPSGTPESGDMRVEAISEERRSHRALADINERNQPEFGAVVGEIERPEAEEDAPGIFVKLDLPPARSPAEDAALAAAAVQSLPHPVQEVESPTL